MAEIKQTKRAGKILNDTMKCCREYRHEFVMPEHLLFVLIDDYNFNKALEIFYSPEMLAERLEDQLENIETVPEDRQYEPEASEQMGQLIEIACQQVFCSSAEAMDMPHLVMGLLRLEESWACYLLKEALCDTRLKQQVGILHHNAQAVFPASHDDTEIAAHFLQRRIHRNA